jgi:hypothetical protein
VAALYRQDEGFKAGTEEHIKDGAALKGVTKLSQPDFVNEEWQYALGAVDEVHYELLRPIDEDHAEVKIRIRDPYE